MHTQHARSPRPSMSVDFDQLQHAKTDASIARLYRTQWGLDRSVTGKVFCDEAECQERLDQGLLPPILSAMQFSRISQGLPYGDMDDDPDPMASIQASRAASPQESPHRGHPLYAEYAALSVPVKAALRNDFSCFLFMKQRGKLDSLVAHVYEQLASDATKAASAERKREQERALEENLKSPEYQALAARLKGNRNYPGLQ